MAKAKDEILSINTEELAQVKPTAEKVNIPTFKLVPEHDPILAQRTEHFDFENPPVNPTEFASSLVETCKVNQGLGLSANQCGFNYKVFVAGHSDNFVAYFNPRIIKTSEETEIGPEGCLSFPHLFLNVVRPKTVDVEYQDFEGKTHTAHFEGLTARVFLHEHDHMDGIVFKQRTKPLALQMGLKKRAKFFQQMEKAYKNMAKMAKQQRTA
jgi:peptide deformylase